jgi:hypothetical protein
MQQGKRGRARSGRVLPTKYIPYGFSYDSGTGTYYVDEQHMPTVQRIFEMVAIEGKSMFAVKKAFEREGVPTPAMLLAERRGKPYPERRFWHTTTIRNIILNDVYRPHTKSELAGMVEPGIAATLDPDELYGVQWYNRVRKETLPDDENNKTRTTPNGKEEHIAIPVPNAGIPLDWIEAARSYVNGRIKHTSKGRRDWPLKGFVHCPCGQSMYTVTIERRGKEYPDFYYVCNLARREGKGACPHAHYWTADDLAFEVEKLVMDLMQDPEAFTDTVRERIQAERDRLKEPDRAVEAYAVRLCELERKKEGYWDLAATGDMPKDVMRARVQEVEKQQAEIRQELDALADENRRLEELEDIENMTSWYSAGPTGIHLAYIDYDTGGPSDGPYSFRNLLQKMGLKIIKHKNGELEVNGHWTLPKVKSQKVDVGVTKGG